MYFHEETDSAVGFGIVRIGRSEEGGRCGGGRDGNGCGMEHRLDRRRSDSERTHIERRKTTTTTERIRYLKRLLMLRYH